MSKNQKSALQAGCDQLNNGNAVQDRSVCDAVTPRQNLRKIFCHEAPDWIPVCGHAAPCSQPSREGMDPELAAAPDAPRDCLAVKEGNFLKRLKTGARFDIDVLVIVDDTSTTCISRAMLEACSLDIKDARADSAYAYAGGPPSVFTGNHSMRPSCFGQWRQKYRSGVKIPAGMFARTVAEKLKGVKHEHSQT